MTTRINETQFLNMFAEGIDAGRLPGAPGKAWAAKYDANRDGLVKGDELKAVYKDVDELDGDAAGIVLGDDNSRDDRVVGGLVEMSAAPGHTKTLLIAREFLQDPARHEEFDLEGSCSPSNPAVKGRYVDKWKCNAFVGEVMYRAGYEMPLYSENGKYYHPNHLHKATQYFDVVRLEDARPGDLITNDHGDGSGHVEIITHVETHGSRTSFTTVGTTSDGLSEDGNMCNQMRGATKVGNHYEKDGETYYVLRPKKPLTPQSPSINPRTEIRS
jgi:hypothetical protein